MNILVFAFIPLILSLGIIPALQSEFIPSVDAIKAKGNSMTEINSNKVCGDRLCSEISDNKITSPHVVTKSQKALFPSSMDYTVTGPEIDPDKGYAVIEIGDGLYWLTDGMYQVMFLATGQGVILVDAPMGMGTKIQQAISEVTSEKVTHFIYSHIHKDHVGSASLLPKDTVYISHSDTAEHLIMKNDPQRPVPTVTFDDNYTLNVGDQRLELSYIGDFHSKGDIVVNSPAHKVIMAVDFFHPNAAPFQYFGITRDMGEHIAAHDKLLEMDWDIIVSGHEPILGTPEHLKFNKEFTLSVLDNAYTAMKTTKPSANYFGDLANKCAELTVEQYTDLKDIEVSPVENCVTMVFYAMID
ncbi:MBL fold metallo-hydrolase [Nitrosopumilus adriaticus]|uniref:MBL fold metallo-hydrolase n=1 Tax=Nitrosopumilus adriaticus TaxID=1580092 RepID=UPI00352D7547